jgi:hypothetical protein
MDPSSRQKTPGMPGIQKKALTVARLYGKRNPAQAAGYKIESER